MLLRLPLPHSCHAQGLKASCWAEVLRGAASLAVNDALRLAPFLSDPREPLPHIGATALDEIEAVRVRPYPELHRELAQDAVTVAIDQALEVRPSISSSFAPVRYSAGR